jgi:transcription elongation factor Elf1
MSLYVDIKYLNEISFRLQKFAKKDSYLFNFRCPYCGDSSKSKNKARGYVYKVKGTMLFKCHNCGKGTSFGALLKYLDTEKYKQYIMERFTNGETKRTIHDEPIFDIPKYEPKKTFAGLKSIAALKGDHPAKQYVMNRQIPEEYHTKLFFAPKFFSWCNTQIPNKFPEIKEEHPRLIIPFYDDEGQIFAFQGRAFGNEIPKYITLKLDTTRDKVYGLDTVDFTKTVFVVEGPIDSMFLNNSIAMAGADMSPSVNADYIFVYDNEPRNKEIVRSMEKVIDEGYAICVWPETVEQKDINDMILSGKTKQQIANLILENSYKDLEAKMKISSWKR